MRVLAFNYDNCLTHPQAQENVQKITTALDVDLVSKKNFNQKKYMTANLKALLRKPSPGMVPMLCTGCRYGIIGNAFKVAKKHKIPIVVIGWSPIEDTPFKEEYLLNDGKTVMRGLVNNILQNPRYLVPSNMIAAVKDYFHNYQHIKDWNVVLKLLNPGIKLIQFYDYITYDPDMIQSTVENEVQWRSPDGHDSWQFDCKVKLLQNYFYNELVNFTATDGYLSSMVREGFITRTEALERLNYMQKNKEIKLAQLHEFLEVSNLGKFKEKFV